MIHEADCIRLLRGRITRVSDDGVDIAVRWKVFGMRRTVAPATRTPSTVSWGNVDAGRCLLRSTATGGDGTGRAGLAWWLR